MVGVLQLIKIQYILKYTALVLKKGYQPGIS